MSDAPDIEFTKLVSVSFVTSTPWNNETTTATLGPTGNADIIVPCRLNAKAQPVPIKDGEAAMGLLIRRRQHDRIRNRYVVTQTVVPWGNVRGLGYAEDVK